MATRSDIEALIAAAARGEATPRKPERKAQTARATADVDYGEAWRELSPTSQAVYLRLRAIEARSRAAPGTGQITLADHAWMSEETGETAEDKADRLRLMGRERPRPSVTPEWRAAMAGVVARWRGTER